MHCGCVARIQLFLEHRKAHLDKLFSWQNVDLLAMFFYLWVRVQLHAWVMNVRQCSMSTNVIEMNHDQDPEELIHSCNSKRTIKPIERCSNSSFFFKFRNLVTPS